MSTQTKCPAHWLAIDWESNKTRERIFARVPRNVSAFCRAHGIYPVQSEIDSVWWWRVIWPDTEQAAIEAARAAGFTDAQVRSCGGTLLYLVAKD